MWLRTSKMGGEDRGGGICGYCGLVWLRTPLSFFPRIVLGVNALFFACIPVNCQCSLIYCICFNPILPRHTEPGPFVNSIQYTNSIHI